MLVEGGDREIRHLRHCAEDTRRLLTMLFDATDDWPNRLSSDWDSRTESPWWSRESTVFRLLVPIEKKIGGYRPMPTFLFPTRQNVSWLKTVGQRLCAMKPQIDRKLQGQDIGIKTEKWGAELGAIYKLLQRAELLLDQSTALFLSVLMERDVAYEFLNQGQRTFDEQERLLLSFLTRGEPPQERLAAVERGNVIPDGGGDSEIAQ